LQKVANLLSLELSSEPSTEGGELPVDGLQMRKSTDSNPTTHNWGFQMNSAYIFVAATILLGVYGQIVLKWQTNRAGPFPATTADRISYLRHFLFNPWVISSLCGAALAAVAWIVALSRLELSRVYPFVSASFVLVLLLSALIFHENLTALKVVGAILIVSGLIIGTQG
jgi:drug/metabolite transporter (DMT)-like permease